MNLGGTIEGINHFVAQGECFSSIAEKHGHAWKTLWDHPRNSELRQRRNNPNILLPGDQIYIPQPEMRLESVATDRKHCFVRKGIPAKLRLQFCIEDSPRSGERYILTTSDGRVHHGNLDSQGRLEAPLSPEAEWAQVIIGEASSTSVYHFRLGHMDPITKGSGVQKRLINLGRLQAFEASSQFGIEHAIAEFQESQHLEKTGAIDDPTRAALQCVHGG